MLARKMRGLGTSEVSRYSQLEDENARLKWLAIDLNLNKACLRREIKKI
jgi:hypothetical protein